MKRTSSKPIIGRVNSLFRPTDSDWVGDVVGWIGEIISAIKAALSLVDKYKTVTVKNHSIFFPSDLEELVKVYYKGKRLPISQRRTLLKDITSDNTTVEEVINPYIAQQLALKSTQFELLEDQKEGASEIELQEIIDKQKELSKQMNELILGLTIKTTERWYHEYYIVNDNQIITSFSEGQIDIYYKGYSLDEEGWPNIIDEFNYKQAVFYYICAMLLFRGYKHSSMNYDSAMMYFERYLARAQNQCKLMGLENMDRFAKMWTRLGRNMHFEILDNPDNI